MAYDRTAAVQNRIEVIARDLFGYDETLKDGLDIVPVPGGWDACEEATRRLWRERAKLYAEAAENMNDCLPCNHGLDVNGLAIAALRAVPSLNS